MNIEEIRALYTRDQRRDIEWPDMRRMVTPYTVRHIGIKEPIGAVTYSDLSGVDDADRVIDEEIAYFEGIGHDFEWKYFSYDQPPDLLQRLRARGFKIEEAETVMVCDLATAPQGFFDTGAHDIRPITDPADAQIVADILAEVWKSDESSLQERLANYLTQYSESIGVYVAYVDDSPVSAAWITFHAGQFAGLWGGSTLEAYRGRGLYTALLAARARAARSRGVRYLTIDASPMSRPIVERRGFVAIATSYPCNWEKRDR